MSMAVGENVRFRPIADIRGGCFKARMESLDFRNAIYDNLGTLRAGTLSFWGGWFGKPYDNYHRIAGAEFLDDTVIITLDQAETLTIEAPRHWSLDAGMLLVGGADRLRFQWFLYGALPNRESLRFNEYRRTDSGIEFATDFPEQGSPKLDPSLPAVQLHSVE